MSQNVTYISDIFMTFLGVFFFLQTEPKMSQNDTFHISKGMHQTPQKIFAKNAGNLPPSKV